MLKYLTPMLAVESAERSRDFYCGRLGFVCLNSMEHQGKLGWCLVGAGGPRSGPGSPYQVEVMFSATGLDCGSDRETRRGVVLYFNPDDIGVLYARYKAAGVPVSDLRVTFYKMKEFTVEDPDGYQLWFGQETDEPPTAVEE